MRTSEELLYWSNKAYGKETPFKMAGILLYEVVDILKEQTRLDDYPDEAVIRKVNRKTAVEDTIAMTQLFCTTVGLDFYESYIGGCNRAIARCKEKLEGKGGF